MATQIRLDHETRTQQILSAARELIAGGGSDGLTIRAVAEKVGVTEAAIYRHVASKEEVLLLLMDDVHESLFKVISEATFTDRSSLDKLEHMLHLHLSYVELRRGISFVVIAEAAQFQEPRVRSAGRRLVEDYLELVEGIVAEGVERGEIHHAVAPDAAAVLFFGMVQATVTRWLFDAAAHPLVENASSMWQLFRASLEQPTRP
ncbi:MAG: TetR/AcrR family transcriptional regulator [Dehalococcoidia bacterium]